MLSTLRSLYICYYPLTEPLVQTQVVAYLAGLAQRGHRIHLLTFETERLTSAKKRNLYKQLKRQGITWHHLRYHKRPSVPATMYDTAVGVLKGLRIMRRYQLNAVHARSHVPATMGLILKKLTGCRLIFDIRGLLAEEYVDAGSWRQDSLPYRLTKAMEKRCIESADGIVVLTERVKHALFDNNAADRVQVIPCCAALTHIEAQSEERGTMHIHLNVTDKTVMVYAGKFGGWYMEQEMVDFFLVARETISNLHFLVLTQSDQQIIREIFGRHEVSPADYTVTKAEPEQVGAYLAAADFAISFIQACPSKIASSPTKIGEYLAAGLPVVSSSGIGDMDHIIADNGVGILVSDFTTDAYRSAVQQTLPLLDDRETKYRCQSTARAHASLQNVGVPRYHSLYTNVASGLGSP